MLMKHLAALLLASLASVLATISLTGCDEIMCGRNSSAVRGAEKLEKQYLTELHRYVVSGQCKFRCSPDILKPLRFISTREPVLEMDPDGDASITLAFCFDRGVELLFKDTKTDQATISVGWGSIEWEYIQLWSKPVPQAVGKAGAL
jgi:hypothetical protein